MVLPNSGYRQPVCCLWTTQQSLAHGIRAGGEGLLEDGGGASGQGSEIAGDEDERCSAGRRGKGRVVRPGAGLLKEADANECMQMFDGLEAAVCQ